MSLGVRFLLLIAGILPILSGGLPLELKLAAHGDCCGSGVQCCDDEVPSCCGTSGDSTQETLLSGCRCGRPHGRTLIIPQVVQDLTAAREAIVDVYFGPVGPSAELAPESMIEGPELPPPQKRTVN